MRFDVYADLSRPLTESERSAVAEAMDASVPGGGCVGFQGRAANLQEEVFFFVFCHSSTITKLTNQQGCV